MNRKKKVEKNNLKLAVVFVSLFLLFVFISLSFKIYYLVRNSSFDGKHSFNVEFKDKNSLYFASFSPQEKSIYIISSSFADIPKIPIDGVVKTAKFESRKITSILAKSALVGGLENLTVIDVLRLAFFSKTVPPHFLFEGKITQANTLSQNQKDIYLFFKDPTIISEKKSIEIINATETSGLGNRLANYISNIGGNVILVKSDDLQNKSKIIYQGSEGYTVRRINKFLNLPTENSGKNEVADVIIVIAKDLANSSKF